LACFLSQSCCWPSSSIELHPMEAGPILHKPVR
jgi:hypothetical protein